IITIRIDGNGRDVRILPRLEKKGGQKREECLSTRELSMKNRIPSFEKGGRGVYYADSCRSLVEAAQQGEVELRALGRHGYPGGRLPAECLRGLSSVGYWDAKRAQEWGLPPHRNEGIEFTFMETGQTEICVEGAAVPLHSDEILITRPWQEH